MEGGCLGYPGGFTVASQPLDRILPPWLVNPSNPAMSPHSRHPLRPVYTGDFCRATWCNFCRALSCICNIARVNHLRFYRRDIARVSNVFETWCNSERDKSCTSCARKIARVNGPLRPFKRVHLESSVPSWRKITSDVYFLDYPYYRPSALNA